MATIPLALLQMPYPNPLNKSIVLPATVWFPAFVAMSAPDANAGVQIPGYCDIDGFLAWFADHRSAQEIGRKVYSLNAPEFWQVFGAVLGGQMTLKDAVFSLTQTPDTPQFNADGTPKLDGQGQPVLGPFFASATQIIVDVTVAD